MQPKIKNKRKWFLQIVYESAVVNEYLDDLFPDNSILPKDPYLRAHQKILAERLSSVLSFVFSLAQQLILRSESFRLLDTAVILGGYL